MRNRLPWLVLFLAVAPGIAAQRAGDAVITLQQFGYTHLVAMTPQGVGTTFASLPNAHQPDTLAVAPMNDGAIYVQQRLKTTGLQVVQIRGSGTSVVAPLPATFTKVPGTMVDAGGDILLLNELGLDRGVFRLPRNGGPLTTLAHTQVNANFNAPFAMAENLFSGDLIVLDTSNKLHRIPRVGRVTTVKWVPPPVWTSSPPTNLHTHHATGQMHFTMANHVMRLDPVSGTTTTLIRPLTNKWKSFYGLDHDPYGGGYYVDYFQASPLPTGRFLARLDPGPVTLTTVSTLGIGSIGDLVTWGSRQLGGRTRPIWGQPYFVDLSIPPEARQHYLVGAAISIHRGIWLSPRHRVPLDPDPLLFLSLLVPSVFVGFQGMLDGTGRAPLKIHIPAIPSLPGFRFYLAAITYDGSGVRTITDPFGVTIE